MTTLKLDILTHDLDLSSNNIELIEGLDEIAQKLRTRYLFFLGEWFLDLREGIPYYEKIFVKPFNQTDVNSILREVAETTPGVAEVTQFDAPFDSTTRQLAVSFTGKSDSGEPLDFGPFIIGVA